MRGSGLFTLAMGALMSTAITALVVAADLVCFELRADATCDLIAVSVAGDSSGYVSASVAGDSQGSSVAVSAMGQARGLVSAGGAGSQGNAAVAAFGGAACTSGPGMCLAVVSAFGGSESHWAGTAVSLVGDARCTEPGTGACAAAAAVLGDAECVNSLGCVVAVSATGDAHTNGAHFAVAPDGDASVSGNGCAVSVTGHASTGNGYCYVACDGALRIALPAHACGDLLDPAAAGAPATGGPRPVSIVSGAPAARPPEPGLAATSATAPFL